LYTYLYCSIEMFEYLRVEDKNVRNPNMRGGHH